MSKNVGHVLAVSGSQLTVEVDRLQVFARLVLRFPFPKPSTLSRPDPLTLLEVNPPGAQL